MIQNGGLRWFVHIESKDDANWIVLRLMIDRHGTR